MPYKVVQRGSEYCVVKADDPGGKSFGCHPTVEEAGKQIGAIQASEAKAMDVWKPWVERVVKTLGLPAAEIRGSISPATLSVYKDAAGKWRWVLLSSSSYEDRDEEIVSQKALEQDIARADAEQDWGPLLWWHVPGLEIGQCDFNAMHGRVLVESGTFISEGMGDIFKSQAPQLGASLGFFHPEGEPDAEGVFHHIRRFERSILPKEAASNRLTALVVEQEESTVIKEKIDQFRSRFGQEGVASKMIESVLSLAEQNEEQAKGAGLRTKETETPVAPEPEVVAPAPGEETPAPVETPAPEPVVETPAPADAPTEPVPAVEAEKAVAPPPPPPAAAAAAPKPEDAPISAMTMGQLVQLIGEVCRKLMAPTAAPVPAPATKAFEDQLGSIALKMTSFEKQLQVLIGEAPRSVAERVKSTSEDTLLDRQSSDVQEHLKDRTASAPAPDKWLDPFVQGLTQASGVPGEALVLGGPHGGDKS